MSTSPYQYKLIEINIIQSGHKKFSSLLVVAEVCGFCQKFCPLLYSLIPNITENVYCKGQNVWQNRKTSNTAYKPGNFSHPRYQHESQQ
ncbi:hypothetical protein C0J52_08810 [Blattella germanica]|nr:hypothetical protein C0J52_08810 [Blattella germanica]